MLGGVAEVVGSSNLARGKILTASLAQLIHYIPPYICVLSLVCVSFIPTSTDTGVLRTALLFAMRVCLCVFVYMM